MKIKKKELYSMSILALLALSFFVTSFNIPTNMSSQGAEPMEQGTSEYWHSYEPIEDLHLDYQEEPIETRPIHLDAGSIIDLKYPVSTYWHELYPVYCNEYHLSSWVDNGDLELSASDQIDMTNLDTEEVSWYHVDTVTTTIFLTRKDIPGETAYLEYEGPYTPKIYDPLTTYWHEIYPIYCREYHLASWVDNGDTYLSESDQIDLFSFETQEISWWHVDRIATDIILTRKWSPPGPITDPITTLWHELYPTYCNYYHLSSFKDNGDGYLSASDQIDMTLQGVGSISWYHVQRVTWTMWLAPKDIGQVMAIEYTENFEEFPWMDPLSTHWHEVYPYFCNKYHLSSWEDNGDGILSPSDQIDLTSSTETTYWHVDRITIDIIVRRKIINPISTIWRRLYPVFGSYLHITGWIDGGLTGQLSPGDKLTAIDEEQTTATYDVDEMTVTLVVTPKGPGEPMYIEFEGGFTQINVALLQPVTTYWSEVYPLFGPGFHLQGWDDNGDGILSASDQIELFNGMTTEWYHVDSVSYDVEVTEISEVHDVAVIDVKPWKTVVGQEYTININVTVTNEGGSIETFTLTAYADLVVPPIGDEITIGVQIVANLAVGETRTVLFVWNTTGVAKGNYIISAYATPVAGEIDLADNTFIDGLVTVTIPGDCAGEDPMAPPWCDGRVFWQDLLVELVGYGATPADQRWAAMNLPRADFNNDLQIFWQDLLEVLVTYGTIDP